MTAFALLGAEWVLWLLVALSIISVAIMIERGLFYARRRVDVGSVAQKLASLLDARDIDAARQLLDAEDSMPTKVASRGLENARLGASAMREVMNGELVLQRTRFERRLIFLGTLGNNAPFIGLFGTVLGIIKAFRDLSLNDPSQATGGASAVMAGISEALVATAVGLAVALPAVVAFNMFKSVVKGSISNTETLSNTLMARFELISGKDGED